MGLADWIFLAVLLGVAAIGALVGFGKGLKFTVDNKLVLLGLSILFCYCFGGMILDIPFIRQMLEDLASNWASVEILVNMHLEVIIFYIVFFIITIVAVKLLTTILNAVFEADNTVMKILNKVLGVLFFEVLAFVLMFLIFQIIMLIGTTTATAFENAIIDGGGTGILIHLYHWNPMAGLAKIVNPV